MATMKVPAESVKIRIDDDLLAYLRVRAGRERRSQASIIRQLIADAARQEQQPSAA